MEVWLVPNATQHRWKDVRDATKALPAAPGLIFRIKIHPQHSMKNVVLIFLLVSLVNIIDTPSGNHNTLFVDPQKLLKSIQYVTLLSNLYKFVINNSLGRTAQQFGKFAYVHSLFTYIYKAFRVFSSNLSDFWILRQQKRCQQN